MALAPELHFKRTAALAAALPPRAVYEWLVTRGYFPEPYVLPPCFAVTKHPAYGHEYFKVKGKKFAPRVSEYQQVHFPKTDYTDRTFGILDPELNSDIAFTVANNWSAVVGAIFSPDNKVCCYSFPVPLDVQSPGQVGNLRSGRMIYEFVAMAENDVAAVAHRFNYLVKADVKNFYPSLYTHSIPWALHGKSLIRMPANRNNFSFFGNRLDKLFQSSNDGCTNGVAIGPAVSDLAAEIVMSAVDRLLSSKLDENTLVLRFKDDYRILAKTEGAGVTAIKALQAALKEYRLELNDEKSQFHKLPDGIFRPWVSQYHAANNSSKSYYTYRRFQEAYLSVVGIDRANPGCGVIDRFLADLVTKKHRLRVRLDKKSLPKILSLLLMLGRLRTKAFPKVLATIEAILRSPFGRKHAADIAEHLDDCLRRLAKKESENRYLIAWICYFVRSNNLEAHLTKKYKFHDPVVRATYGSISTLFVGCPDFKLFREVKKSAKRLTLLQHLDVFNPQ